MYRQLCVFKSKTCKVDKSEFKTDGKEIKIIVKFIQLTKMNLNIRVANVNKF